METKAERRGQGALQPALQDNDDEPPVAKFGLPASFDTRETRHWLAMTRYPCCGSTGQDSIGDSHNAPIDLCTPPAFESHEQPIDLCTPTLGKPHIISRDSAMTKSMLISNGKIIVPGANNDAIERCSPAQGGAIGSLQTRKVIASRIPKTLRRSARQKVEGQ
ncbi:hypothetical protein GOP47_0020938 [Adiantum capillus-veneris]|uniref:Uncharacterized protein n=1 Tax=Adiantum capillus-veneris TaxID=13818 RepID=A0A9D4Z6K7_ADICA|nr:hypothetical protein GOP47_0020938 [Adiantum capillus-veneris]